MKYSLVLLIVLCIGCGKTRKAPLPDEFCYYKYVHVKEVYDEKDFEKFIKFEFEEVKLDKLHRDSLLMVLRELHIEYLVADSGDVLLKKINIEDEDGNADANMLQYIEQKLDEKKRIKIK